MAWRTAGFVLTLVILTRVPDGGSGHQEDPTPIPVVIHYDSAFAATTSDPLALLESRLETVGGYLEGTGIRLVLQEAHRLEGTPISLCEGPGSFLDTLWKQQRPRDALVLGVTGAFPDGAVLGCAFQDGYAMGSAVAIIQDPPYLNSPWAMTDLEREMHAELLYGHEIGHLLGGMHGLSWPPGVIQGLTGTIMYPTLQHNIPRYSGLAGDDGCLVFGNACRMRDLVLDVQRNRFSQPMGSVPPVLDLHPAEPRLRTGIPFSPPWRIEPHAPG